MTGPLDSSTDSDPAGTARAVIEQQELAWSEARAARLARRHMEHVEASDRLFAEALVVEDDSDSVNDLAIARAMQEELELELDQFDGQHADRSSSRPLTTSSNRGSKRTSRTSPADAQPLQPAERNGATHSVQAASHDQERPHSPYSEDCKQPPPVAPIRSQPAIRAHFQSAHSLPDSHLLQPRESNLPSVFDTSLPAMSHPSSSLSPSLPFLSPLPSAGSDVSAELVCGMCRELYSRPVRLPCSHSFCLQCVERWADECQAAAERRRKDEVAVFGLTDEEVKRVRDKDSSDNFTRVELPTRCSVCCMVESDADYMLDCRSCKLRVHRSCYGVVYGQDEEEASWRCEPCSLGVRPVDLTCVLCSNKQDRAYKRTKGPLPDGTVSKFEIDRLLADTAWIHVSCAHYHQEPCFTPPENGEFRSPIFKLDALALKRKMSKLTCMFCRKPAASLQCCYSSWSATCMPPLASASFVRLTCHPVTRCSLPHLSVLSCRSCSAAALSTLGCVHVRGCGVM